jgi:cholinesterase
MMADAEFTCPSAQVVNSRIKAGVSAVWRYRFYGGGPKEGSSISSNLLAGASAAHGAELAYVWDRIGVGAGPLASSATPQKTAVSNTMQKVWADFAKNPSEGPVKNGWPKYQAQSDTLVRLMYQNETKISLARGDMYDAKCSVDICRNRANYAGGGLGGLI